MLIYLIRHGETKWNLDFKVQGKKDVPLNENGISQANILAKYFENKDIDMIYSSNLMRAKETANIIAKKLNKNVQIVEDLQEINFGVWEGYYWEDIKIEYKDFLKRWENDLENIPVPEGESYGQVQKRVYKAFNQIISKHDRSSNIIIVSHGVSIKVLIAKILDIPIRNLRKFSMDNASISIVEYNEELKVISINNTFHLSKNDDI
ncbi:MAG TPA: alpha-ribazole phosphatase [Exilispira sp.]|nr:alpha-ribazole phosphatase [Exilispira sp.]